MRSIKTCGLLAVAALAVTLCAGAGTASATVLCEENVKGECAAENILRGGAVLTAHSSDLKFEFVGKGSGIASTCEADMEIETEGDNAGDPLAGEVLDFDLGNCTSSWCGVPPQTVGGMPWETELQAGKDGAGNLTLAPGQGETISFPNFTQCGIGKVTCTWSAAELEGTLEPGPAPSLEIEETTSDEANCPPIILSATFEVEPSTWEPFSADWMLKAQSIFGTMEIDCDSTLEGSLLHASAGTISGLKFSGCTGGWTGCTGGSAKSLPYTLSGGKLSSASGTPRVRFANCFTLVDCVYNLSSLGNDGSSIYADKVALSRNTESSTLCPTTASLTVDYPFVGKELPDGVFVIES